MSYSIFEQDDDFFGEDQSNDNAEKKIGSYEDILEIKKLCGPQATWRKYWVMHYYVSNLRVKDKRFLFNNMRNPDVNEHTFFPRYGFTAGEFAVYQKLTENNQKEKSKSGGKKRKRGDKEETDTDLLNQMSQ